jgi:hypothetical protein
MEVPYVLCVAEGIFFKFEQFLVSFRVKYSVWPKDLFSSSNVSCSFLHATLHLSISFVIHHCRTYTMCLLLVAQLLWHLMVAPMLAREPEGVHDATLYLVVTAVMTRMLKTETHDMISHRIRWHFWLSRDTHTVQLKQYRVFLEGCRYWN